MPKYRKKPVVIEATQWFKNGDHPEDEVATEGNASTGEAFGPTEGKVVRYFRRPDRGGADQCNTGGCNRKMCDHGWIDTKEGGHIVCPGDFIITGIQGEQYPCKPDIFDATYEAVS